MPTQSPNFSLWLYNSTTDLTESFLSFRDAEAGPGVNSNMIKIDTALKSHADSITALNATRGAIRTPMTYSGANSYSATVASITTLYVGLTIIGIPSQVSDATMQLTINGTLGPISIMKVNSTGTFVNLAASDFLVNHNYYLIYDGTRFVWVNSTSQDQIYVITGTAGDVVILASDKSLTSKTQSLVLSDTITASSTKATPVDADVFGYLDSAASFVLKKLTWANIKSVLKTYYDTVYMALNGVQASRIHQVYDLGDSLSVTNGYDNQLQTSLGTTVWLVNAKGVGGQRTDEILARVTSDVISNGDAEYAVVLAGVNDCIQSIAAATIEANLQSIYTALHNAGIKVIAVTINPFKGYTTWTSGKQTVHTAVNAWIMSGTPINVDYKIDGFTILVDPSTADTYLPAYDSGDHLHPNATGYNALGLGIYTGTTWIPNATVFKLSASNNVAINQNLKIESSPTFLGITTTTGTVGTLTSTTSSLGAATATSVATGTLSITNGAIISGTYTPTITNTTNVDASTPAVCQYLRVGNVVTVSGSLQVDPTAAGGAATVIGISLPIASNLATLNQLGGTAATAFSESARIIGDGTNDRATMQWSSAASTNQVWGFNFTYIII